MAKHDEFSSAEEAAPSELEIAKTQVRNLMMERELLRQALHDVIAVVANEQNYRVWASDLNTCIYTHQPFTKAREILGLPSWGEILDQREEERRKAEGTPL